MLTIEAILEPSAPHHLCFWVFDLLVLHGLSQRINPLWKRRMTLDGIMDKMHSPNIAIRSSSRTPTRYLADCAPRGLEGIVSKRTDKSYQSGNSTDWIKVKAKGWRERNACGASSSKQDAERPYFLSCTLCGKPARR